MCYLLYPVDSSKMVTVQIHSVLFTASFSWSLLTFSKLFMLCAGNRFMDWGSRSGSEPTCLWLSFPRAAEEVDTFYTGAQDGEIYSIFQWNEGIRAWMAAQDQPHSNPIFPEWGGSTPRKRSGIEPRDQVSLGGPGMPDLFRSGAHVAHAGFIVFWARAMNLAHFVPDMYERTRIYLTSALSYSSPRR